VNRALALFLSVLAAAGVTLAAACGGDGGGTSTGDANTAIALTPGALPTPSVVDGVLDSSAYGYRARVPDGWTVQSAVVTSEMGGGDAFFAPESDNLPGNEVRTNISVLCDRNPPAETLDEFVQQKKELFESLSRMDVIVEDHDAVSGREAKLIKYKVEGETYQIEKAQLLFLGGGCGWNVAVTTRVGELEKYLPLLESFAESFELKAES